MLAWHEMRQFIGMNEITNRKACAEVQILNVIWCHYSMKYSDSVPVWPWDFHEDMKILGKTQRWQHTTGES